MSCFFCLDFCKFYNFFFVEKSNCIKDSVYIEDGYTGDTYCKACGKKIADGESFKAEAKVKITAISEVDITNELKKAGIDTVAKIEEALYAIALTDNYKKENSIVYDAKLMASFDNGKTFVEATEDNYPAGGKISVTIPYPEGTDATYDFTDLYKLYNTNIYEKIAEQKKRDSQSKISVD